MSDAGELRNLVKLGGRLLVPQYLIDQANLQLQPLLVGQDDTEERARRRAEHLAQLEAEHATHLEQHAALTTVASHPVVEAVLELHRPQSPELGGWTASECHGCPGDAEYGAAGWPCETWQLIADELQP